MRLGPTTLLALLSACTWVTDADVKERLGDLDDDGDGYVADVDCDEANPDIHPDQTEIWYDGIDSDCLGDPDDDADKDGVSVETDCDDNDPNVYPSAPDAWYDGIDSDCAGNDDYDQDNDGYVRDEDAGAATAGVDGTGSLPSGDCDDEAAGVNPGQADAWYDGVDTDCGGEDDFDQDGDGRVPDEYDGEATTYVTGSGSLPAGDCDDLDSDIYAGAPDTWYDGVDSDCAGDNDFDRDLDTHDYDAYGGDDCDDEDPAVYGGAVESIGDEVDQDCDGGDDTFPLSALDDLATLDLVDPHDLRWSGNSTDLYLSLAAPEMVWNDGSETDYFDSAVALGFPLSGLFVDRSVELLPWAFHLVDPTLYYLSEGHDFLATDQALLGATGLIREGTARTLRVGGRDFASASPFGQSYTVSGTYSDFTTLTVALDDDGNFYAVGCEDGSAIAQVASADISDLLSGGSFTFSLSVTSQLSGYEARVCDLHFYDDPSLGTLMGGLDGKLHSAEMSISSSGLYTYGTAADGDDLYPFKTQTYDPASLVTVSGGGATYTVFYDALTEKIFAVGSGGTITIDSSVSASTPVSAALTPGGMLLVGYVDNDQAQVTYGLPAGTALTSATTLVFDTSGLTPIDVSVWADENTATGGTDFALAVLGETEVQIGFAHVDE